MDYTAYLKDLQGATLFDLHRLRCAIDRMLEDPQRQAAVKKHTYVGMDITYYDPDLNKLVDAVIIEKKRSRALVHNQQDGKRWNIPFHMINLEGVDTSLHQKPGSQIDRATLSIGDQVGFHHSSRNEDLYGTVIKLNPKKARIKHTNGEIWGVSYALFISGGGGSFSTNQ